MREQEKLGPWGRWQFRRDATGPYLVHVSVGNAARTDYDVPLYLAMPASDWLRQIRGKSTAWMPTPDKVDFARALDAVLAANLSGVAVEDDRARMRRPITPESLANVETARAAGSWYRDLCNAATKGR